MNNLTAHIETITIEANAGSYLIKGYIRTDSNGNPVAMERVIIDSKDSEELTELLVELSDLIKELG